ncbi:MAG: YceD family protein [Tannerellaceae bacterium]
MGKFDTYKIDLKNLEIGTHEFEYQLGNKYFTDIDGTEVQKGKVKVLLTLKRTPLMFDLSFKLDGVAYVPCDRCLDDVEIPIDTTAKLIIKFGHEYSEESDEVIVIPEEEGEINLAWFIYEFVALAIPMKHVHAPGKCNKSMSSKLKKHSARQADDEEVDGDDDGFEYEEDNVVDEAPQDPRWDALKDLLENNNN